MSENLRINQYSYGDICNMIISANHPADLDAICKEAYEYIETKIASYLNDTSQIELFSHEDVDICEKLIIFSFSPFDAINNLYVIFDALNKQGYKVLYGTLGQALDESIVTDGMSAYAAFLYAALIKLEEKLEKICAGLSDKHKELYKKYFYAIFNHYKLITDNLNISKNNSIPSRENLRINQYSHAEMWKKLGAAKKIGKGVSPEINDICKEAYDYIHNKTSVYLNDTSKSEIFDHEDVDICERLIIFGYNVDFIVHYLHFIFEALKKHGHSVFCGSMGKAVEDGRITPETTYYFKAILESLLSEKRFLKAISSDSMSDDTKKMLTKTLDDAIDYYRTISDYIYEKSSQPAHQTGDSSLQNSLKKLDSIFAARIFASKESFDNDLRSACAENLLEMTSDEKDISVAFDRLEYAAWFDKFQKTHSHEIVSAMHYRLEKAGYLSPMHYVGTIGSKMSEIRDIFNNAPSRKRSVKTKAICITIAVLALIVAYITQFTPLGALIRTDDAAGITAAVIAVICAFTGWILFERDFLGAIIGLIVGYILGFVVGLAMFILPIICLVTAVICLIIAFSGSRKAFDKYMEEKNFRAKAEETIKYIECAAAPFEEMDSFSGLDDILSYYHSAIAEVKSYLNQL